MPSSVESVQFPGSPGDRTAGMRVGFGGDHNKAGKGATCYSTGQVQCAPFKLKRSNSHAGHLIHRFDGLSPKDGVTWEVHA